MQSVVSSFVSNVVLCWFGPEKPAELKNTNGDREQRKQINLYLKKERVFVYNATAKIANGALVAAVASAVFAIFSIIGPLFALFIGGSSVAIHWNVRQSLPVLEKQVWKEGECLKSEWMVTRQDPKNKKKQTMVEVEREFGLGKSHLRDWERVSFALAGIDFLFNPLPIPPEKQPVKEGRIVQSVLAGGNRLIAVAEQASQKMFPLSCAAAQAPKTVRAKKTPKTPKAIPSPAVAHTSEAVQPQVAVVPAETAPLQEVLETSQPVKTSEKSTFPQETSRIPALVDTVLQAVVVKPIDTALAMPRIAKVVNTAGKAMECVGSRFFTALTGMDSGWTWEEGERSALDSASLQT